MILNLNYNKIKYKKIFKAILFFSIPDPVLNILSKRLNFIFYILYILVCVYWSLI